MLVNYDDYEKKTDGFRSPQVEIIINGKSISKTDFSIARLQVKSSAGHEASSCQFMVSDVYNIKSSKINSKMESTFLPGLKIEIKLGYKSLVSVFIGFINTISFNFSAGGIMMNVHCLDAKALLFKTNSWKLYKENDGISEVVNEILKSCKEFVKQIHVNLGDFGKPGENKRFPIFQVEVDNYNFLVEIAKKSGATFAVIDGDMYFSQKYEVKHCISLEWGKNIIELTADVDLSNQVSKVIVNTKTIDGMFISVEESGSITDSTSSSAKNTKPVETRVKQIDSSAVNDRSQAEEIAKMVFKKMELCYVSVHIQTIGIPELRPGSLVDIKKFSKKLDGSYYISIVDHSFSTAGYTCNLECCKSSY